jgi:adenosine deaminase
MYRAAARLVREGPRENLLRLVREVVEDAAADGAVWVEPHVNPLTYVDDPAAALDLLDMVIDEGRRTAARLGIGFGVLMFARRDADPAQAVETARLAARRADHGVVSFGLAGDEAHCPAGPFAEAFAIARDAGLISAGTRANSPVRPVCAPHSMYSARDGSPTAYERLRTRLSSPGWPRKASSWTSAPPPTSRSAS